MRTGVARFVRIRLGSYGEARSGVERLGLVRQFRRGAFWSEVVRRSMVRQAWNLIRSKNEKNSKEINH